MRTGKTFFTIIMLLLIAAFVYGITELFLLRYETGDIYPIYSSLRADPLGTKAFYEAINDMIGLSAQRKYQPLHKFVDLSDTTMLYIGMSPARMAYTDRVSAQLLDNLIVKGNRLVMTFVPEASFPFSTLDDENLPNEGEKDQKNETKTDKETHDEKSAKDSPQATPTEKEQPQDKSADTNEAAQSVSLAERWGVTIESEDVAAGQSDARHARAVEQHLDLPDKISWHGSIYFEKMNVAWRVLYTSNRKPVVIERSMGSGSIVLCADSYLFSNEAMRNERHPALLAWVLGSHPNILFDETHFGIAEEPGIASLIRQYRLSWFAAACLGLALLFVWRNAVSFVPPYSERDREKTDVGKDIHEGLVNLLRRNIAADGLVTLCLDEWEKSLGARRKEFAPTLEEIRTLINAENARPAKERNPVELYRTISRMLAGRQHGEHLRSS